MTSAEDERRPGDGASRWGDDLDLPERVIVVPAVAADDEPEWEGPPTEAMTIVAEPEPAPLAEPEPEPEPEPELALEPEPVEWQGPPTEAIAVTPAPEPRREETDPSALRPSAPEPVSISRVPSRSRTVVSRLRAFIGLVLVVILAGVGLAAAIGAAVLLVAFVLKRAFGS